MKPDLTKVGVVGAGNMGSGIAQKYATEGFQVVLLDLSEDSLVKGRAKIEATLAEGVKRRVFSEQRSRAIKSRLTFTTDASQLADATLVVEAVFENREAKKDLFRKLDEVCVPTAIFATNTSSFFVTDLAGSTNRPDRFVGLHYFYHPAKNKLVEVVKGNLTSEESFARAWKIQEQIGKIPIESSDAPGFIVNRFFVPWLNEAMRIVDEGVANIATVEAAVKQFFGIGMGPFELMNVTGVPITLHAATTLAEELGAFYVPSKLIRPIVETQSNWDLSGTVDSARVDEIASRLLGVVFAIATQIVFEEKVCTIEDCDLGARVGLRWKHGPFELFGKIGIERGLQCIDQIKRRHADLKIPSELMAIARSGSMLPQFVTSRTEREIGYITFNRPDALNALNETVVEQLHAQFLTLSKSPGVSGIIIEGRGKAFVAGADTHFFVEQIEQDNVERIVQFARQAQELFYLIDNCPKPVVCCIDGLALGGGLELALACDYIVATSNAAIGFPETGIGIYPGLGGTQRTPRRIGVALTRWLVLTGEIVNAATAHTLGLFDDVVSPAELKNRACEFALKNPTRREIMHVEQIPEGFTDLAKIFRTPLHDLLNSENSLSSEAMQKSLKKMSSKAPLALSTADELIHASANLSMDKGLEAELLGLSRIFKTKDAFLGLSSIGKEKPLFKGE